jgi:hypothetical protein
MKGIIFNLLEQVITDERGDDAWDDLLESAGLDGVYTSLGNYPEAQLIKLIHMASALLERRPEDVLRLFGEKAIPLLAQRYPVFFEGHESTRTFLLTLNDVIHPEVRKLYPGADVPDFSYDTSERDALTMVYTSPRRFCALAEGLIQGAASHFSERIAIAQSECMHRGDVRCVFRIAFDRQVA